MTTDGVSWHLTSGDHLILEGMVTAFAGEDTAYARMLRRKARHGRIYLAADLPENAARLGSWVTYTVNGVSYGPHRLVEKPETGSDQLSIGGLRGLALLGLLEGSAVVVETDDGRRENITLVKVAPRNATSDTVAAQRNVAEVIAFPGRCKQAGVGHWAPEDDPGPSAA